MGDDFKLLLKRAGGGDLRALARLMSMVESLGPSAFKSKEILDPGRRAFRVGVTGPPGAGKSTLVSRLLSRAEEQGLRVAVLAVDPSSPLTGGAVLGDRIRYQLPQGSKVFVRSLGTRGLGGGLSASCYLMLRLLDWAGFDWVIVETVGVGQTELDIAHVADRTLVLLVPESGDSIQMMKAGLLEIADAFVLNKFDRPGAEELAAELRGMGRPLFRCVATTGTGVEELYSHLVNEMKSGNWLTRANSVKQLRHEAKALRLFLLEKKLNSEIGCVKDLKSFKKFILEHGGDRGRSSRGKSRR